jgi:hypothetical protein
MVEPTLEQFHRWKLQDKPVKYVRMDNAGENLLLEKRAQSRHWKMNINFEYTGRDTLQHNSLAETGFPALMARSRAMMWAANIPLKVRYKVIKECLVTAGYMDALIMVELNGLSKSRIEHWLGRLPPWVNNLRTFGEAGVVKIKKIETPKVADRGETCMFVGYNMNSGEDVFRMWNPKTNRIHRTHDIRWLDTMYFKPSATKARESIDDKTETNRFEVFE